MKLMGRKQKYLVACSSNLFFISLRASFVLSYVNTVPKAIDWLTCNEHAKPVLASVLKGLFYGGRYNPSDHDPVMAVYEIF